MSKPFLYLCDAVRLFYKKLLKTTSFEPKNDSRQTSTATVAVRGAKYVTIPDASFRDFLKSDNGVKDAFGTVGNEDKLNIYHTDVISMTEMDCSNQSISDLTGIEYFVGLTELICNNNSLTSIDKSKNTALIKFKCSHNSIVSLDVSKNTELTSLYCSNNSLSSLYIGKNTALTKLYCNNHIETLDISSQKSWEILFIHSSVDTNFDKKKTISALKVNVLQKKHEEVKKAKKKQPNMCYQYLCKQQ